MNTVIFSLRNLGKSRQMQAIKQVYLKQKKMLKPLKWTLSRSSFAPWSFSAWCNRRTSRANALHSCPWICLTHTIYFHKCNKDIPVGLCLHPSMIMFAIHTYLRTKEKIGSPFSAACLSASHWKFVFLWVSSVCMTWRADVCDWLSACVNEWVNEWVNECVCMCVYVCVCADSMVLFVLYLAVAAHCLQLLLVWGHFLHFLFQAHVCVCVNECRILLKSLHMFATT